MSTVIRLDADTARARLDQLLTEIYQTDEPVVVERAGVPVAAIISFSRYQQLVSEADLDAEILDDVQRRMPGLPSLDAADALMADTLTQDEQALRDMLSQLEQIEQHLKQLTSPDPPSP
jgi:prevent-host-death family protein